VSEQLKMKALRCGMRAGAHLEACLIALCAVAAAACGVNREPAEEPATVYVEAPAADDDHNMPEPPQREPRRSQRLEPPSQSSGVEIEISNDAGSIHISSASDAGVRVWGTLKRFDGGFSFRGGFSSSVDAGDAGP
jgi:hypothetical protein